jgi:hypothetical protein
VDAGNPVFHRSPLGNTTTTDTVLGGYSIASAENLEAAVVLAKGCPFLEAGGGVEVGELTLLNVVSMSTTAEDHARATGLEH